MADPNRFFFDYFAKRLGSSTTTKETRVDAFLLPPGYNFDPKSHPFLQIATKFQLRTGATTGHPDQSLLVNSADLLQFIQFSLWIAHGIRSTVKIYTIDGKYETSLNDSKLVSQKQAEQTTSKLAVHSEFVLEFLGEFENNFAAHIFLYDQTTQGYHTVRSDRAYAKKVTFDEFPEVYPAPINFFGDWGFGTPWPVDFVYTWVDKDDPGWISLWERSFPTEMLNPDRYSSRDELKFSIRSVCKFAPWFNRIYIVSNCRRPAWLKEHRRIHWITHEEIFPESSVLPTFNSHAIEACIHKIAGLSEHFVYFNDDMLIAKPAYYNDFFDESDYPVVYLEPYGTVHPRNLFDQTKEYLQPSINSALLLNQFNPRYKATRLHRHTPYALRRSVLDEIEHLWPDAFERTRRATRRSNTDVNVTSFLHPHYCLATRRATPAETRSLIVRPGNTH